MKIVSLAPSNTEILYHLGAEEKVAATTSLCDYPAEVHQKPSIGGWSHGIDFEKVARLNPDMVLASDDLQDGAVEKLRERGLKAVQFRPHKLEDVFRSVENIGKLVGRIQKAEETVTEMREELKQFDLNGARVYCEEWTKPPMVSGNWIPGLVEKIGGEYMIDDGQRSRKINLEEIQKFNPEHIVLNVCGAGENADKDSVLEREGWQNLTAVKNGNVHVIDDALLNRPTPRLVEGAREIFRICGSGNRSTN